MKKQTNSMLNFLKKLKSFTKGVIREWIWTQIATCGGVGFGYAPGTLASMLTSVVNYVCIKEFTPSSHRILLYETTSIIILFILGLASITVYLKNNKGDKDPKEVVIDEVIGQLLAICICQMYLRECNLFEQISLHLVCFLLFRLFDILKPWPIGWIDKNLTNAFGVIADDVLAGIFAGMLGAYLMLFFRTQRFS
jgi:phosphatidylglycerophosphatase A